jgi:hypothetical protein
MAYMLDSAICIQTSRGPVASDWKGGAGDLALLSYAPPPSLSGVCCQMEGADSSDSPHGSLGNNSLGPWLDFQGHRDPSPQRVSGARSTRAAPRGEKKLVPLDGREASARHSALGMPQSQKARIPMVLGAIRPGWVPTARPGAPDARTPYGVRPTVWWRLQG